jgi:hypothetical protein
MSGLRVTPDCISAVNPWRATDRITEDGRERRRRGRDMSDSEGDQDADEIDNPDVTDEYPIPPPDPEAVLGF